MIILSDNKEFVNENIQENELSTLISFLFFFA